MRKLLTIVLISCFGLICCAANAQSSQQCLSWMVWKEARGEGILTQRAVVDVLNNRQRASGKDACTVLRTVGQFPYAVDGVGTVPKYFLTRVMMLSNMSPVVGKNVFYFNDVPHSWAKKPQRIGGLWFY